MNKYILPIILGSFVGIIIFLLWLPPDHNQPILKKSSHCEDVQDSVIIFSKGHCYAEPLDEFIKKVGLKEVINN